jgi:hypothetical protein
MKRGLLFLALPVSLLACNKGDDKKNSGQLLVGTPDADVGPDDATPGALGHAELPIIPVVPNVDDDDRDGAVDWGQGRPEGDNDFSTFTIDAAHKTTLTMSGQVDKLRVWKDGAVLLNDQVTTVELAKGAHTLELEAGDYLAEGRLVVSDNYNEDAVEVLLMGAPLILNHHLQPSERVAAMKVSYGGSYTNASMIDDYQSKLGGAFEQVKSNSYEGDVWVQDEIEFATLTSADGTMQFVIDSIRNGQGGAGSGLDDLAEDQFEDADFGWGEWGGGRANSQDSFGNLEVSPPVTVDGVHYPFGRIYYGDNGGSYAPTQPLQDFLAAQRVQSPVEIDSSWLCVGHVDEYSTFIPDPSSEKGFKFVYGDVDAGYALLESMDPDTFLTRYEPSPGQNGHDYATVGEIVEDDHLRAYNEDIQRDVLDPQLEQFKAEFGLEDSDILLMPSLFEEVGWCGGTAVGLIPGMANMIVADDADGQTTLFLPDPMLRTDVGEQTDDPMIDAVRDLLPSDLDVMFLDDWVVYHIGMGEVHCGTNVVRTPHDGADWWLDSRHLLEN